MRKYLILILFLYLLTLFQNSFLVHFDIRGPILNFVFYTIIFISLFEKEKENLGPFSAFFGGFFLDLFSENFIGYWILILLALSLFIKYIFKRYVRFPILQRF